MRERAREGALAAARSCSAVCESTPSVFDELRVQFGFASADLLSFEFRSSHKTNSIAKTEHNF